MVQDVTNIFTTTSLPFRGPTVQNVLKAKHILQVRFGLAYEIVDIIIDFAEYWPCSTVTTRQGSRAVSQESENLLCVSKDNMLGNVPNEF